MTKRKLLIATTNKGKFKEILHVLETLPFDFVSLKDLPAIEAPEETENTIEKNALLKARYYGEKTQLLTIVDDTGFFIPELHGWPGVAAATVAESPEARRNLVLEKMKGIPKEKRSAWFASALVCFDPKNGNTHITHGKSDCVILEQPVDTSTGSLQYDSICYSHDLQKAFSEATVTEKSSISHRGKAASEMKYYLQNTYCGKHIVVPFGLIIKDGKVFMQLRNDPHRPEYHKKWEFPGGGMEMGETLAGNVVRELKEESGYDVEIVKQLNYVGVETHIAPTYQYQVYLIPFVCKIIGGDGVHRDEEVLETGWFSAEEVFEHDLLGTNVKIYRDILPELKEIISENHL